MRTFLFTTALVLCGLCSTAQELNINVKVNYQKLQFNDPKVFQTLEQSIREFINSQKWTDNVYETDERINCNLVITIQEEVSLTSFKADISLQASRPIYGSSEETPLFNILDERVPFTYEQYQPVQYSRNSYNDNLSSVLSFYSYIILGLDGDSFAPSGGESYYRTAQEILSSLPQGIIRGDDGWNPAARDRNRHWLVENLLSPRIRPYRQAMYDYHRQGLDVMTTDATKGRQTIAAALQKIGEANQVYPNSMIVQVFNVTKSAELIEIFKRGTFQEQDRVIQVMSRVDPAGSSKYRAIK